nr:PREDICTED: inositol 1,4,5-trisphosphate receptor-interacting protein-like 1 [Opisthocomus hoazin]
MIDKERAPESVPLCEQWEADLVISLFSILSHEVAVSLLRDTQEQNESLLHTLCSGFYLSVKKTFCWFQILVKAPWQVMPQSWHCWLTMLPFSCSWKLQLTNASKRTLSTEMRLGLQLDDSNAFLIID